VSERRTRRDRGRRIRADAGGDIDGELDVRECDLASLDSVRDFADRLAADYDAVDVLCNNAGVMAIPGARPRTASRRSSASITSGTSRSPVACSPF